MKVSFFLILLGLGLSGVAQVKSSGPYIPLEKNLDANWVKSLSQKGDLKVYKGKELDWIGMPCGGIGAGQLYITGEGKFCFFESVYNKQQQPNAGHGLSTGYQYLHPQKMASKIENSFSISISQKGKAPTTYRLSREDFDDMCFTGEYPLAKLAYRKTNNSLPLKISSEVFSPFVPLSLRKSANPVTVIKYSITNTSNQTLEASITGRLKSISFPMASKVEYVNTAVKEHRLSGVSFEMRPLSADSAILKHPQLGGFSLSVLDQKAVLEVNDQVLKDEALITKEPKVGSVRSGVTLRPNQTQEITFLVSWYFANYYENGKRYKQAREEAPGWVGHIYNNWYANSFEVAKYVASNFDELYGQTRLFRDTYNDNSLPYWLANRITMPVSTLAAGNVAIWENGRFYAYEGVGFCMGTCGHVYNFVSAISKLFPELERSVRLLQDFSASGPFSAYSKSGRINFRGYGVDSPEAVHSYASDAQSGYVLKAYREHLMSPDDTFLDSIWDRVKGAIGYHIYKDGAEIGLEPNGVLEGLQTFWDPMWYGPNPYNNTLYLAALRAAEEMALVEDEPQLAKQYHRLFENGQRFMNEHMWNGEFYVHLYPRGFSHEGIKNGFVTPEESDKNARHYIENFNQGLTNYYVGGCCDAQQLFGQNWAHQLGLGYILPRENCRLAAQNIFRYNWTPDIATVYDYTKPNARILADKGEPAMVNGSWPKKAQQQFENIHDKFNVWTGLEYEAACDMINEGLIDEALISIRSIEDRYDGRKRNPWNEVEGSDHYSRAMHSWNVLLALSGFTCDGPAGKLGFAPKLNPENFKSFFSSPQGWGNISQVRETDIQYNKIELKYGRLVLKKLLLESETDRKIKEVEVKVDGRSLECTFIQQQNEVAVRLKKLTELEPNQTLSVLLR